MLEGSSEGISSKPAWPSLKNRQPMRGGTLSEINLAEKEDPKHTENAEKVINLIVSNASNISGGEQIRGYFPSPEVRTIEPRSVKVDKDGPEISMILVSNGTETRLGAVVSINHSEMNKPDGVVGVSQGVAFPEGDVYGVDVIPGNSITVKTISLPIDNGVRYELLPGLSRNETVSLTNYDSITSRDPKNNGGISVDLLTSQDVMKAETPQQGIMLTLFNSLPPAIPPK